MADNTFHPALIIRTGDGEHEKRPGGGGLAKVFGDVAEAQERINRQIDVVKDRLMQSGPSGAMTVGLARLKYAEKSIAKSHRATDVFNDSTCPVVGDLGGPGELLVLVNPPGLDNLKTRVLNLNASSALARHLTGIESYYLLLGTCSMGAWQDEFTSDPI